jgi:hypothetical protein
VEEPMARLREDEVLNLTANRQYSMGRRRFVFVHGILLFGIPMFCVMSGFEWYSHQFHFKGTWLSSWLLFSLVFWCAIGYMLGWSRWRSIERRVLRSRG